MKKILLFHVICLFMCPSKYNKQNIIIPNINKVEKISLADWKNSITTSISKTSEINKKNIQITLNEVSKHQFERLLEDISIVNATGRFFALIHLEGEIIEISLHYFVFNKDTFKRNSWKNEYGKWCFSKAIVKDTLNYSDFKNVENRFIFSGYLVLTEITKENKLISSIEDITESVDRYIY